MKGSTVEAAAERREYAVSAPRKEADAAPESSGGEPDVV